MHSGHYITVFFVIILAYLTHSQDCISYGRECTSHAACCGGCCFDNICVDTYRSCYVREDLCLEHYCPPGEECYIFRPEFRGYDAQAACKKSGKQAEEIIPPRAVQV